MYTWGYLKNSILAKLDLDESEANTMSYLNRFYIYANEAMTQICSTIKPKQTFFEFEITDDKNKISDNVFLANSKITMPSDFISFGDDLNTIITKDMYGEEFEDEAFDCDFRYYGYNQIICHSIGKYSISYNARWVVFTENTSDERVAEIPADILDCIPSYVASQCMKVDDEYKSSVFRNEYEILFARIDATEYKSNKHLTIGGDW